MYKPTLPVVRPAGQPGLDFNISGCFLSGHLCHRLFLTPSFYSLLPHILQHSLFNRLCNLENSDSSPPHRFNKPFRFRRARGQIIPAPLGIGEDRNTRQAFLLHLLTQSTIRKPCRRSEKVSCNRIFPTSGEVFTNFNHRNNHLLLSLTKK